MSKKLNCPCGRTIFDISDRRAGDELTCPWCSKTVTVPPEGGEAPTPTDAAEKVAEKPDAPALDAPARGGPAQIARPAPAGEEPEKSLDQLLREEEAARRSKPSRRTTQEKAARPRRGLGEGWFLLLWTSIILLGMMAWIARRSGEGRLVINWKYPWWFWAIFILGAAVLGLILQLLYVLFFGSRGAGRPRSKKRDGGSEEEPG